MTQLHLSNTSSVHFAGWLRCNIDWTPPHVRGYIPDTLGYELGKRTGLDTRHIDVNVGISPGETVSYDLAQSLLGGYVPLEGWDPDAKQHFGGVAVTVAGVPLQHISTKANGAALDGHWMGKVGGLVVNLWIWHYPDQPSWCEGRIAIVASSPGTPAVRADIPADFVLRFGDAIVMVPGLPDNAPLMQEGDWLADGQPRLFACVLCFPRHRGDRSEDDLRAQCRAIADQQVCIKGLKNLHQDGNPYLPANFDAKAWAANMLPRVIACQHSWVPESPMHPAQDSRRAGAQGAQALVGAPAIAHAAAVGVFTVAGLDVSWPMVHLEPDGSPLDWRAHPTLRMAYGRVNRRIAPDDDLGKPFEPTTADSHGYAGPDTEEHWFDWTAWVNARLNGDPASQWILHAHACLFLFRFVTEPPGNWLTTARGVGWALGVAVECYRNLEDRELANAIKQRVIELRPLIEQMCAGGGYWSWSESPSIGASPGHRRSAVWQVSVLALMLDWAGFAFGVGEYWNLAAHIADDLLTRGWVKTADGRWHTWDVIAEDGSAIEMKPDGTPYWDSYYFFGSPFAVATMLRHNDGDPRAVEIWNQYLSDNPTYEQAAWLAPTARPTVGP